MASPVDKLIAEREDSLTWREQVALTHIPLKDHLETTQKLTTAILQHQIDAATIVSRDQIIETQRRLHELNESAKRERAQEVEDRGRYMTSNAFGESQHENQTWRLNIEKLIAAQSNDIARILAARQTNAWLPAAVIAVVVGVMVMLAGRLVGK